MYFANMAPVLFKWIPLLKQPIDGGVTWKGEPLFGKNKTWRGVFSATLVGYVTILLQRWLQESSDFFASISFYDYTSEDAVSLGILLGFGAIIGDLLKSFFKRRVGIKSGQKWIPFDQLDFVIGGLIFGSLIFFPGFAPALIIMLITPILHIATNITAYHLKLKSVPW
jgi:CDP-2,3-bis-(O-geranylgeranyl)-sn-glycerol synthase